MSVMLSTIITSSIRSTAEDGMQLLLLEKLNYNTFPPVPSSTSIITGSPGMLVKYDVCCHVFIL